jgi:hypothetical protein
VVTGKQKSPYLKLGRRAAISSVATIALTNMVMDQFMTRGLGFDRKFLGRRYSKQVETDRGTEEFVVTMAHPQNLSLKIAERIGKTFASGEKDALERMSAWKYELTPLFLILNDISQNKAGGADQIYNTFDNTDTKVLKSLGHAGRQIGMHIDKLFPTPDEVRLKKVFAQEVKLMARSILNTISYQYLTTPEALKKAGRMNRLEREFERDIDRSIENDTLTKEKMQELFNNYHKNLQNVY